MEENVTVTTVETVTVTKKYMSEILTTILRQPGPIHPQAQEAFRYLFQHKQAIPGGPDDLWTLPAVHAWWLRMESAALSTYGLDESAAASYEHPAVAAEMAVEHAVAEQAPATDGALWAALNESIGTSPGT